MSPTWCEVRLCLSGCQRASLITHVPFPKRNRQGREEPSAMSAWGHLSLCGLLVPPKGA